MRPRDRAFPTRQRQNEFGVRAAPVGSQQALEGGLGKGAESLWPHPKRASLRHETGHRRLSGVKYSTRYRSLAVWRETNHHRYAVNTRPEESPGLSLLALSPAAAALRPPTLPSAIDSHSSDSSPYPSDLHLLQFSLVSAVLLVYTTLLCDSLGSSFLPASNSTAPPVFCEQHSHLPLRSNFPSSTLHDVAEDHLLHDTASLRFTVPLQLSSLASIVDRERVVHRHCCASSA
ncbi:hypothetical protein GX51_05808 [Blastomyces parvus]|uniref:Uncharacterized protein n=1 Tax=Blastomyces parvus TaxID=2060905 RepID=A0A2B7WV01_9EURO|nr:hypothetical protein GX51_05808 [Blastomyces parvus]